jgi:hypothetical protein
MSLRLCLWLAGLVLAAAQCTCDKPASFQGHIKESPVVFVGTARLQGNEVKGSVMRPIKGCLEFGTTMTLMTNPDCPIAAPPLDTVALFTGRQYTYDDGTFAVVLDSCGLQKALVGIPTADITWMNKQFEVCEGETVCPSGAAPLTCRPCSSTSGCAGEACVRNPCDACEGQSETCGNDGGESWEATR